MEKSGHFYSIRSNTKMAFYWIRKTVFQLPLNQSKNTTIHIDARGKLTAQIVQRQWHAHIIYSERFTRNSIQINIKVCISVSVRCIGTGTTLLSTYENGGRWRYLLNEKYRHFNENIAVSTDPIEAVQSHRKWMWTLTSWHRFIGTYIVWSNRSSLELVNKSKTKTSGKIMRRKK